MGQMGQEQDDDDKHSHLQRELMGGTAVVG